MNCGCNRIAIYVVVAMLCCWCGGTIAHAQTYYETIEEMKQSMNWWESCTVGTGQQLYVECLDGVNAWECQVQDASGNTGYDVSSFLDGESAGVISVADETIESGNYYIIVEKYVDGVETVGCVEITYHKLNGMPEDMVCLVGSSAVDYSVYQGEGFPYPITYTSSNKKIATVNAKGMVKVKKKTGDVTITATVEYPNQEPVVFEGELDVTNPSVPKTIVVARNENLTIDIPGTSEKSSYYFSKKKGKETFSNKKCYISAYGDEEAQCLRLSIEANNKKTKQKVTITIDGKKMSFTIQFSNPQFKKEVLVVKKGKTLTLPVKGTKSASVITYSVSDEDIAKVTKQGKLKGNETGTTWVNIDVDGKTFYALLVVQKGKLYKVVKYAADQIGVAKYSQEKRMEKGYYDCSSLVWRSYQAAGVNIGNTTWAFNSDAFGNYYYKKGKHYVGTRLKGNKKLKCGDIILRGKYVNGKADTNHAELYIGDGYVIEAGGYGVHLSTTVGADIAVRPLP